MVIYIHIISKLKLAKPQKKIALWLTQKHFLLQFQIKSKVAVFSGSFKTFNKMFKSRWILDILIFSSSSFSLPPCPLVEKRPWINECQLPPCQTTKDFHACQTAFISASRSFFHDALGFPTTLLPWGFQVRLFLVILLENFLRYVLLLFLLFKTSWSSGLDCQVLAQGSISKIMFHQNKISIHLS